MTETCSNQSLSMSKFKTKRTCLFVSSRVAMLFTLPANKELCTTIPTLKLANSSSPKSAFAGDDGTENGIGFVDGELEPLDDGSWARIDPPNRVECRSANACASLVEMDLSTWKGGQFITPITSMNHNLARIFPFWIFGIVFCIAMAKTLLGKSQTLTCGEGRQE